MSPTTTPHIEPPIEMPQRSASTRLLSLLQSRFGFSDWRDPQDKVVEAIAGGQNVILHAATGFGKSICFQVPALERWEQDRAVAIVITPLIALIEDQAAHLKSKGIPVAYIHNDQTPDEKRSQMSKIRNGEVALAYISPERFCGSTFQNEALGVSSDTRTKISFFVIDESHLPAQWGRTFRYAYGAKLGEAIRTVSANPQVVACTATPTADGQNFLSQVLGLGDWRIIQDDLHRPNLNMMVQNRDRSGYALSSHKQKLRELLSTIDNEAKDQPMIVYCSTRREVEELHEELVNSGVKATLYHGNRTGEEKLEAQSAFMSDDAQVMVCTSAFGTGIDKSNIRWIIHFNTPGSIEQWAQEAGRAGRDGASANCRLFFSPLDLHTHMHFARQSNPSPEILTKFYSTLWSWVKPEDRTSQDPTIWINMAKFLDPKEKGFLAGLNQTCLVVLQNYGLISIDGWHVRFTPNPTLGASKSEKISADVLACFPTEQEHEANRARLLQHLKLLVYTIQEGLRDSSLIPGLMQSHLLSNGLIDRVAALDLRTLVQIDRELINTVLLEVNRADCRVSDLIKRLKSLPPIKIGGESVTISDYGRSGIYSLIEHACWLGLLRMQSSRMTTYVSLTPGGMDALLDMRDIDEVSTKLLNPSTDLERMLTRIGHAAERETLEGSLSDWYNRTLVGSKTHAEVQEEINRFGTQQFDILGSPITGDRLVRKFTRKGEVEEVTPSDRTTFLVYVFPQIIQQHGNALPEFDSTDLPLAGEPSLKDLS